MLVYAPVYNESGLLTFIRSMLTEWLCRGGPSWTKLSVNIFHWLAYAYAVVTLQGQYLDDEGHDPMAVLDISTSIVDWLCGEPRSNPTTAALVVLFGIPPKLLVKLFTIEFWARGFNKVKVISSVMMPQLFLGTIACTLQFSYLIIWSSSISDFILSILSLSFNSSSHFCISYSLIILRWIVTQRSSFVIDTCSEWS